MVFFQKKIPIFFIFLFLLIKSNCSYVPLQFTKQEDFSQFDNNFTIENITQLYIEAKFTSTIDIGNPPQKTELIYSSERHGIIMIEDQNFTMDNFFNKKLSSSIDITHDYDIYFYVYDKPVTLIDSLFFPFYDSKTKKTSKIEIKNYPFIYLTKTASWERYENIEFKKDIDGKAYMIYGSKVHCNTRNEINENLPSILKHNNITDNYNFVVEYNNKKGKDKNYDFEIIIGKQLHQLYPDKYSEEDLKNIKALAYSGEIDWIVEFDEVYYFPENFKFNIDINKDDLNIISFDNSLNDNKTYSNIDRGQMSFEIDFILCPKFYYFTLEKLFTKYEDKCILERAQRRYAFYVCDKDFKTDHFPPIFFYHKELNYTFILKPEDIFKVIGDKKYYLLVYDLYRPNEWYFGRTFLEKYAFNYNMEPKEIGFYKPGNINNKNKDKEDKDDSKNILIINLIWIGVLIIVLVVFFFIGKKILSKMRKKRANELEDDYDYTVNGENNEKKNENDYNYNNESEKTDYNKLID